MKRILLTLAAVAALALGGTTAYGASGQAGQCDGYNSPSNTKIDTSDDDLVLPAGLTVCIHAGGENTGQFVTDGILTLGEYIVEFGLLNHGGQVPGVSNYVIYGSTPTSAPSTTPSEAPSTAPSVEPSVTPSVAPSPEASVEPSTSPSSAPTTEPSTVPSPTASQPLPTQPNTSTASETNAGTEDDPFLMLIVTIGFIVVVLLGNRNSDPNYRIDR